MDFTVDTTGSAVDVREAEGQISAITDRFGFEESSARSIYITSAPTVISSVSPIISPPTSQPSITGLVVSIELSRLVSNSLTSDELDDIIRTAQDAYGVSPNDIIVTTGYTTSGVISVEIPPDQSEEIALAELAEALATALGISTKDINLFVNHSFFSRMISIMKCLPINIFMISTY